MEEILGDIDEQAVILVADLGDAVDETRQTIFMPLVVDNMLGMGLPT